MSTPGTEGPRQPEPSETRVTAPQTTRELEPGLLSMFAAALVLLIVVGVVIWTASSTPYGRSVVVTIRNP